jgi:ATP-binding cassette subfamily B protein RaxB
MSKTVPVILQNEIAECALACVAMICGYHGKKVDLTALRRTLDPATRGSTMKEIAELGDTLGLSVKSLKLGLKQIDKLALPAIIHWNLVHYVVLVSRRGDEFIIHDPALGRRTLSESDFSRSFTGLAQEFSPRPSFVKSDTVTPVPFKWLVDGEAPYAKLVATIFALALVMQLLVGVLPFGAQILIDRVLTTRDPATLVFGLALGTVGLGLYCSMLWLRSTVVMYLNSCLDTAGTQKLTAKMLAMPYDFFARRDVGSLLSRFTNLTEVRKLLTQGLAESAVEALIALTLLAVIGLYLPSVGAVAASALLAYAAFRGAMRDHERDRVGEMFQAAAGQHASLIETLVKIDTVKANALETMRERFWLSRFMTYQNSLIRKLRMDYRNSIALLVCFGSGYGLIAWFIARGVFDDLLSMGEAFTVFLLAAMFFARSSQFLERLFELLVAKVHLDNLADIVHGEEEARYEFSESAEKGLGRIELRDVGFRYSAKEPFVFRHVSIDIAPGECVAITGASGCGKSTLLSLMLGLRSPTEGEVLIDGLSVEHWDKKRLRRRIGSVLQGDALFIGSVQENVTFFEVNAAPERVHAALDACALKSVVARLAMGEHTMISDTPMLSGGERQRLLLARALYKRPKLLLLDEASSHLDEATESLVNDSIRSMGVTRVMVAHRRQTIDLADTEVCLDRSETGAWSTVAAIKRRGLRAPISGERSTTLPEMTAAP